MDRKSLHENPFNNCFLLASQDVLGQNQGQQDGWGGVGEVA